MTYYIKADRLIPGRAVRVYAKDDEGIPRGEYDGYWQPERGVVVLYPAKGTWMYGRLKKHTISDRQVRRESYICRERR